MYTIPSFCDGVGQANRVARVDGGGGEEVGNKTQEKGGLQNYNFLAYMQMGFVHVDNMELLLPSKCRESGA